MTNPESTITYSEPGNVFRPQSSRALRSSGAAPIMIDPLTDRTRSIWIAGDFARIGVAYATGAEEFVRRLDLTKRERVLDAACGTGNLAIPAAQLGASVTGLDIAPNLIATARAQAAAYGLCMRFDEGNVESMPYDDGAFSAVMSMFGVMFAPRPERVVDELFRVTAPGGRIALANWTLRSFIGAVLRAHTELLPPPPMVPSVLMWGDECAVRDRLTPYKDRIKEIRIEAREIELAFPSSPAGVVELFREFYGPSARTYAALDAEARVKLSSKLLFLWDGNNIAEEGGTRVTSEYLDIRIDLR